MPELENMLNPIRVAGRCGIAATEPLAQVGALPWRMSKKGLLRIMLITSRSGRQWIIPKGWPIAGKSEAESAGREALEEAGIIGDLAPRPLGDFHYSKHGCSEEILRVRVFPLRVRGTLVRWQESKERKRRWFSISEATNTVANNELAALIQASSEAGFDKAD
ncbi:NUDIX hydrolase [Neorhizobium sp. T786]|uniref:NUDIX hydrolase n=1 Tax=Pseudorhizobium xiangyangii TaxID=2883104 RepID=UPI001D001457|nr:NUDIX hydrolase [Neorhizobium xiangyangii]MCB5204926.1 NUDIX hydrolase [Neorhizobium xiangyangii]